MRTRIAISDALLTAAKRAARDQNTTLALRDHLEMTRAGLGPSSACGLQGRGLQPGTNENDWSLDPRAGVRGPRRVIRARLS